MKNWLSALFSSRTRAGRSAVEKALVDLRLQYVPTFQAMRPFLEAELRRARRHERPLVVLVITLDYFVGDLATNGGPRSHGNGATPHANGGGPGDAWRDAEMSFMLLGELLHATLREEDLVAYAAGSHRFIVCLPESEAGGARGAVDRIGRLLRQRTGSGVRSGFACYPDDALTLGDLIAHAESALTTGTETPELTILREVL